MPPGCPEGTWSGTYLHQAAGKLFGAGESGVGWNWVREGSNKGTNNQSWEGALDAATKSYVASQAVEPNTGVVSVHYIAGTGFEKIHWSCQGLTQGKGTKCSLNMRRPLAVSLSSQATAALQGGGEAEDWALRLQGNVQFPGSKSH